MSSYARALIVEDWYEALKNKEKVTIEEFLLLKNLRMEHFLHFGAQIS